MTGVAGIDRPTEAGVIAARLALALRDAGVRDGQAVMVHFCPEGLQVFDGLPDARRDEIVLDALLSVIGRGGTLLVPAYTFSFCRGEEFDASATPAVSGPWCTAAGFIQRVRALPGAVRSGDPIHSVVGVGPRAAELLATGAGSCFGPGSVFERIARSDVRLVMIGAPLEEATVRHHSEEIAGVPFRYRKLFTGVIRAGDGARSTGWVYSVRILAPNGYPDGSRLEALARERGICRAASLGVGEVLVARCDEYHALTLEALRADPWLTARGPAGDPVVLDHNRIQAPSTAIAPPALRDGATMREMIDALWMLRRDIVSDGYDAALAALATQCPMTVHEYLSGTECWSWIVPEQWSCQEARLETLDGRVVFSDADHPLHVMSYSLPFEGVVARDELLAHLHVHPSLDDAIPFAFRYYERDWGLCCTRHQRDALTDPAYRVVIRTTFTIGRLKVGEVVVPGESEQCFVLCAHLCHPAMVNDDLTGVVVGMDVMRRLLAGPTPRYTWRLLILPETIGSVAWLSHHEHLIPRLQGGLFLEMLGRAFPHALQHSFAGETSVDQRCSEVLRERDPAGWEGAFRTIIGNDERQFNAPGVRVPMLSLSRVLRPDHPDWPYAEYHSSADTPALVPDGALEESRDLVIAMIHRLEGDVRPVLTHPGEPFCSRYGVHVDAYQNPEGHRALFDLIFLMDGTRTVAELAVECGVSFDSARQVVDELLRRGVVRLPGSGA